ncbi:FIST N-terminal domain-containing protein [Cyanobium sp. WAJ14-Wanaka]|uniref:FIST signal transduction protein n=1 Tax=Cyanobium sp. WAJ14-Wanaka TaxID=2823725 RepID=UPI0020CF43A3|nr:FIST N-terminal domain-containing protein [Cyanobium sp. WAJ14-Wanaka]MCP9775860.1 FIST C-terminal domain-containing protein [Cyanobium sp. WAJ14-Wanaka]
MAAFSLPNWLKLGATPGDQGPWCRTALATDASLQAAVDAVASQLQGTGSADLALVFASASYASDLPRLLPLLQAQLQASHWLGCLGGGVVGTDAAGKPHELEHAPALSVSLLRLPGAELHPFAIDTQSLPDLDGSAQPWQELVAAEPSYCPSMLLLVDPSCNAINDLINGLDYACPQATKIGGIASQHSSAHGSLLFGDKVTKGAVGCLIGGDWRLDPVVAQGCRPIGPVLEIEQAQRNVMLEVSEGNKRNSPVAALQAILSSLSADERELAKNSLFLGVGRSSFSLEAADQQAFLVRNLIGVDPRNGAVAVAERLRVGQQVQFQLRDGTTSRQELQQLLEDQHRRQSQPLAAFLFACLGRGQGLYGERDGDVGVAREIFGDVPMAGAFCNGEIGPVAGSTHLHGYTASWGFFVPNADAVD